MATEGATGDGAKAEAMEVGEERAEAAAAVEVAATATAKEVGGRPPRSGRCRARSLCRESSRREARRRCKAVLVHRRRWPPHRPGSCCRGSGPSQARRTLSTGSCRFAASTLQLRCRSSSAPRAARPGPPTAGSRGRCRPGRTRALQGQTGARAIATAATAAAAAAAAAVTVMAMARVRVTAKAPAPARVAATMRPVGARRRPPQAAARGLRPPLAIGAPRRWRPPLRTWLRWRWRPKSQSSSRSRACPGS